MNENEINQFNLVSSEQLLKPNLAELVSQRIGEWLESGFLKPGDRVPSEQELSERFGVARNVIREAMANLKALGLVSVYQGKGSFVSEVPVGLLTRRIKRLGEDYSDALEHIWEMRMIIETQVAKLAALRRTDEDLRCMKQALQDMEHVVEKGDLGIEPDEAFHFYLVQATQNPILEELILSVSEAIKPSRKAALEQPGRPEATLNEHSAIYESVKEGDSEKARIAMQIHIVNHAKYSLQNHFDTS